MNYYYSTVFYPIKPTGKFDKEEKTDLGFYLMKYGYLFLVC